MLSEKEIEEIREIINRRIIAFTFEALGPTELSREEIKILESAGIIYGSGKHLIEDSYAFGRIAAILGDPAVTMSVKEIKKQLSILPPMTDVERQAIEYASSSAGQYIRGVGDMMAKDVSSAAARSGVSALRLIQDGVSEAIAERRTAGQLKTELFHLIDNRNRDWQRIAHTELNTAIQHGIYREIRENSKDGADQLVFKRPNPDACKYCKSIYLKDDGITPRVFRLKDLQDNNFGLKARDWNAVIGSTHPWCNCTLHFIPDNSDFVKERIIKEKFEHEGKNYLVGNDIDESEYDDLSKENKDKVEYGATLRYTGKTATLDVEKSLKDLFTDDNDEEICNLH